MVELVEGARLESGYTLIAYRGFESPSLRQEKFAMLDGELAVPCNLQSAVARLNSRHSIYFFAVCPKQVMLMSRSCAIDPCEPCQVLTEAALSKSVYVTQISLL